MNLSSENYLGAYRGIPIRYKLAQKLVSVTDLYKAQGSPSSHRFDKWAKAAEVQNLFKRLSKDREVQVDPKGIIIGITNVLEIYRGGDKFSQGTFVNPEISLAYAKTLSDDCYGWLIQVIEVMAESVVLGEIAETIVAEKKVIVLGGKNLNVYQLPDGSYLLNQSETAEVVGKDESFIRKFLVSNSPEALPYKGYKFGKVTDRSTQRRPSNAVPIPLAVAFWTKEGYSDNREAVRLLGACAVETIERRADKAFGISRTEEEYNERFKVAFQSIIAQYPDTAKLADQEAHLVVSSPLHDFYAAVKRKLKRRYPYGVIPNFTKEDIRDKLALLSSYTSLSYWKLTPQRELTYQLGSLGRNKYPDLMSGFVPINVDGQIQKSVFIFQVCDFIVDCKEVEDCVLKRQYVQIAKQALEVDHVFLFLVAPLGATPDAYAFIQNCLPDGINGCKGYIGVLTVKELAEFYYKQVTEDRQQNSVKGNIRKRFRSILEYEVPNSNLDLLAEQGNYQQLSLF